MSLDETTLQQVVDFHGHMCPGLAVGVQAAQIALDRIGPHATDEEVVAVTETDMCAVDAIQFLTGCTFGKGNLRHEDWGKNAFTFFRRSDGKAIRLAVRPDAWDDDPEHTELFDRVRSEEATDEERRRFRELHEQRSRAVLDRAPDELFDVEEFMGGPPPRARIHRSIECTACGEPVMETRIRRFDGDELCQPCFEAAQAGGPAAAPATGRDLTRA